MTSRELLKSLLNNIINDRQEEAAVDMHNYLSDKMKVVVDTVNESAASTTQIVAEGIYDVIDDYEGTFAKLQEYFSAHIAEMKKEIHTKQELLFFVWAQFAGDDNDKMKLPSSVKLPANTKLITSPYPILMFPMGPMEDYISDSLSDSVFIKETYNMIEHISDYYIVKISMSMDTGFIFIRKDGLERNADIHPAEDNVVEHKKGKYTLLIKQRISSRDYE